MIRYARPSDIPVLIELHMAFAKESSMIVPVDRLFLQNNLIAMLDHPHFFVCVIEDAEGVYGMLLAAKNTTIFQPKPFAVEIAWYVRESHRGRKENMKMISFYEQWAKENGCTHVSLSDMTSVGELGKLYERMGYSRFESSYVRKL